MIIRYGGGNAGIKEYLEDGRKMDRHFARSEMDRRIPIEGDLNVTEAIYKSIEDKGQDRYLHITMSFNEPDVTPESIAQVFQQYKKHLMSAYKDDEFNVYAEIHWPKIKESYNHSTNDMEARYPHVHIVVPKRNLLTGGLLNPIGMHEQSVKYLDAIQEKLNRDNGLSSPRDNPRVGSNHYESALSKYKEKEFKSKNGETKREIYQKLIDRDIHSWDSFKELLQEYGEVRIRNPDTDKQYATIKIPGDEKFTNLKANIFNKAYIENRTLLIDPITDTQVSDRIETWQHIQSREIKFISNASAKVKSQYKSLTLPERREFLTLKESEYEQRHRQTSIGIKKTQLPSLPEGNYKPSNFEFAGGITTEGARDLHELRTRDVDYFGSQERGSNRLFLQGDEDSHLQHIPTDGSAGLRRNLYAGSRERIERAAFIDVNPESSEVGALLVAETAKADQERTLKRYAEIRKQLDPEAFLAHVQVKFGIDPDNHPITRAKDGSPRIRVGKYNYNMSDFLTKHIGLDWEETAKTLDFLYEKQVNGISEKPKSKIAHIDDWRRFRNEVFPNNIRTYNQLKNEVKQTSINALKTINSEYYSRRKAITNDETLNRTQKHYFRSVVLLEKLQKIETLQDEINTKNRYKEQVKYPYSNLFYNFVTKDEDFNVKILESWKKQYQPKEDELESPNSIGSGKAYTPENMPSGVEAARRARLVARLQQQENETKAAKLKLGDLRPQPLSSGAVAFKHKEHGKQIFVNHPDRLELNRVTEPDEVAVSLTYAIERFGSPLEIKGTEEFRRQVIEVAAERDMDITFTDEKMNEELAAKRKELGMNPLQSNSIGVEELKLDKSMPVEQAIDKALLASKVAELSEINQTTVESTDTATRKQLVADMLDRHENIHLGFVNDKGIIDIANEDIATFKHLEGRPEQQEVAIAMYEIMQSKDVGAAYSTTLKENGPDELMLTMDAARVIHQQQTTEVAPIEVKTNVELEAKINEFNALLDSAKKDLETKPFETSTKIMERSIIYADSLVYAKRPELEGIKNADERLKILNENNIETIKPETSKEWARIDAEEFKKINDLNERDYAAIEMVNNSRINKNYQAYLQEKEPALYDQIKTIDAHNEKLIAAKEQDKNIQYAEKNSPQMVRVLAQSALIEMVVRHEKMAVYATPGNEVAKADLQALEEAKGEPEEKVIALKIEDMMNSDESYREYVAQNAPEELEQLINEAHVEQSQAPSTESKKPDNDLEM